MRYTTTCNSPVGKLLLASDGAHLIGLWLEGQKHYAEGLGDTTVTEDSLPIFAQTKRWLDAYFAGEQPQIETIPLAPEGSEFRRRICRLLCEIPYGTLTTYANWRKTTKRGLDRKPPPVRWAAQWGRIPSPSSSPVTVW